MSILMATVQPTHPRFAELERLGDKIAELSAQVDTAIARLLTLIREFDDRKGWNIGFRSCADWLAWRIGLDRGPRASTGRARTQGIAALGPGARAR